MVYIEGMEKVIIVICVLIFAFLMTADLITVHGLTNLTVKESNPREQYLFNELGNTYQPIFFGIEVFSIVFFSCILYHIASRRTQHTISGITTTASLIRIIMVLFLIILLVVAFVDMSNDINVYRGGTGFAWFRAIFHFSS